MRLQISCTLLTLFSFLEVCLQDDFQEDVVYGWPSTRPLQLPERASTYLVFQAKFLVTSTSIISLVMTCLVTRNHTLSLKCLSHSVSDRLWLFMWLLTLYGYSVLAVLPLLWCRSVTAPVGFLLASTEECVLCLRLDTKICSSARSTKTFKSFRFFGVCLACITVSTRALTSGLRPRKYHVARSASDMSSTERIHLCKFSACPSQRLGFAGLIQDSSVPVFPEDWVGAFSRNGPSCFEMTDFCASTEIGLTSSVRSNFLSRNLIDENSSTNCSAFSSLWAVHEEVGLLLACCPLHESAGASEFEAPVVGGAILYSDGD